jgi:hypothetical protein
VGIRPSLVAHQGEAAREHALVAEAGQQAGCGGQPLLPLTERAGHCAVLARGEIAKRSVVSGDARAKLVQGQPTRQALELTRVVPQETMELVGEPIEPARDIPGGILEQLRRRAQGGGGACSGR